MLFGNREPRSLVARRHGAFRPKGEDLEDRLLMAVDVGGSTPPNLPAMATIPLGIDMAGSIPAGGAGFSVTDVGDMNGDGFDDYVVGAPTVINQGGTVVLGSNVNSAASSVCIRMLQKPRRSATISTGWLGCRGLNRRKTISI